MPELVSGFVSKLLRTAVTKDTGQNQATGNQVESFGIKNYVKGQEFSAPTPHQHPTIAYIKDRKRFI